MYLLESDWICSCNNYSSQRSCCQNLNRIVFRSYSSSEIKYLIKLTYYITNIQASDIEKFKAEMYFIIQIYLKIKSLYQIVFKIIYLVTSQFSTKNL